MVRRGGSSLFVVHQCGSSLFVIRSFMRCRVSVNLVVHGLSLFVAVRCEI